MTLLLISKNGKLSIILKKGSKMKRIVLVVSALMVLFILPQSIVAEQTGNQSLESEAQAEKVFNSLKWIEGPQTVNVGNNAVFTIPDGYAFLNPNDTAKIMELFHNPPSNRDGYYFGPKDLSWFGLFTYENTGYIKDDEKIDANAVLGSIKQGTEASNKVRIEKGWETMHIKGWRYEPFYDSGTQRLSWAIEAETGGETVVNYNTRILGRSGVTSAVLVASPENLTNTVSIFNDAIKGYAYKSGEKYSEYKSGDKMAEYGLAALIAGGAAAVATKKGFWAVLAAAAASFWKLVVAGIVVFFVSIGKLFDRKNK